MLIIDDNSLNIYSLFRTEIRKYCHLDSEILTLFIRNSLNMEKDYNLDYDTLYIKGEETRIPGILTKTLKAMQYCIDKYEFDYLVRTNLSSFWNFKILKQYCDLLPKENVISALIGNHEGILFPAGSGFIMSKDFVKFCINNKNEFDYTYIDDVSFGLFCKKYSIKIIANPRYDIVSANNANITDEEINKTLNDTFHYRVISNKFANRIYNIIVFQKLYNKIYV